MGGGMTGNSGSGMTGNTGSGMTGNTGSGMTGNTGSGMTGNAGSGITTESLALRCPPCPPCLHTISFFKNAILRTGRPHHTAHCAAYQAILTQETSKAICNIQFGSRL